MSGITLMIEKIVSGGQTGVDLAALDVAIMFGIPHGGWCPKGRINERGMIPTKYELTEIAGVFNTDQENYDARTKANVENSDGTLVVIPNMLLLSKIKDGTKLTLQEITHQRKPLLKIDLSQSSSENIVAIVNWIEKENIKTLNIGGPRESTCPGIYQLSIQFFKAFFLHLLKLAN